MLFFSCSWNSWSFNHEPSVRFNRVEINCKEINFKSDLPILSVISTHCQRNSVLLIRFCTHTNGGYLDKRKKRREKTQK